MKQTGCLAVLAGALLLAPAQAAAPDAEAAPPPPVARDAEVVLLVDLSAGGQPLYQRAADKPFLPASITKAMSALVAFDLIRAGKLDLDQQLPVNAATLSRWAPAGTSMALVPGEQVAVRDLLMGMTTVSANDAASVLAEGAAGSVEAWIGLMNDEAARRGMRGSHFASPNGLPDRGQTHVSAPDLVRLADALIYDYPDLYRQFIGQRSFAWHGVTQENHDPTIGVVPGADGIKTGHTYEAGFTFLGSAQRGDRRLVLVTAQSQTEPGRAAAARELLEWGFNAWENRPMFRAHQNVGRAMVQQGNARSVSLIAPRAFNLALPRGERTQVTARIRYIGPIKAPIRQGAAIARLEITVGGAAHSLPLVAGESVGVAGPFDRVINGVTGLFR